MSALEHRRLNGVDWNPATSAGELHNICKALGVLRNNKAIPVTYTYAEDQIHGGDRETILGLLSAMRTAYRGTSSVPVTVPMSPTEKRYEERANGGRKGEVKNRSTILSSNRSERSLGPENRRSLDTSATDKRRATASSFML